MELYFFLTVNDKQSERGRPEDGRFAGVVSLVWLAGVPDDQVTLRDLATLGDHGDSSPAREYVYFPVSPLSQLVLRENKMPDTKTLSFLLLL